MALYLFSKRKLIEEQTLGLSAYWRLKSNLLPYIMSEETGNSLKFTRQKHMVLTILEKMDVWGQSNVIEGLRA